MFEGKLVIGNRLACRVAHRENFRCRRIHFSIALPSAHARVPCSVAGVVRSIIGNRLGAK